MIYTLPVSESTHVQSSIVILKMEYDRFRCVCTKGYLPVISSMYSCHATHAINLNMAWFCSGFEGISPDDSYHIP